MKVRPHYLLISIIVSFPLFFAGSLAWSADKFPNRTIEVIVPFAAGGPTDIGARAINEKLSKKLETPVVVMNKPGAGGLQGTSIVARAKKTGTLC